MSDRAFEPGRSGSPPSADVAPAHAAAPERSPAAGHELSLVASRRATAPHGEIELGRTDDPQERDADRIAERVTGTAARRSSPRTASVDGGAAPSIVHEVLGSPGTPLDGPTRALFEPRLGSDLSGVRVHRDARAAASASAVDAAAYTVGADIVFAHGRYAPGTSGGRRLVAHELAHVLQQRTDPAPLLRRSIPPDADPQEFSGTEAPADGGLGPDVSSQEVATSDPGVVGASETMLVLQSDDPSLDGRPAEEIAAELDSTVQRYVVGVDTFRESAERLRRAEEQWSDRLNIFGALVEVFNPVDMPDPGRWEAVLTGWDDVAAELNGVLASPATAETVTGFAGRAGDALTRFDDAFQTGQATSDEFLTYMEGFQQSAQKVGTRITVVRDIGFCFLVAGAVVLVAPVVVVASTAVAGAAGLGATGTGLFVGGTTVVGMGVLGATIEGEVQSVAALAAETIGLMDDLLSESVTWEDAIDRFDFTLIQEQGWEGMKRGFVDGVLAYAGIGFEKIALRGSTAVATRYLGPLGDALLARILRAALARAVASGASSAITGALDAGVKAAMAGKSLGEVEQAMRDGFLIGAALGTALGGAGAVITEAAGARVTPPAAEPLPSAKPLPSASVEEALPTLTEAGTPSPASVEPLSTPVLERPPAAGQPQLPAAVETPGPVETATPAAQAVEEAVVPPAEVQAPPAPVESPTPTQVPEGPLSSAAPEPQAAAPPDVASQPTATTPARKQPQLKARQRNRLDRLGDKLRAHRLTWEDIGVTSDVHARLATLADPDAAIRQLERRAAAKIDVRGALASEQMQGPPASEQPIGSEESATAGLEPDVDPTVPSGRLPREQGTWEGEPGNSTWASDHPDVIRITNARTGAGGRIDFVDGEPILKPYATVQAILPTMFGADVDFGSARRVLMSIYPRRWRNVTHVEEWEKALVSDLWGTKLGEQHTWHHEPDVETMSLVPTALHANIPHEGGASAARAGAGPQTEAVLSTHPL